MFGIIKKLQYKKCWNKLVNYFHSHIKFVSWTGMESSFTLLGMTCIKLHVHLTQTILTKKFQGSPQQISQLSVWLIHGHNQLDKMLARIIHCYKKRINSKLTAFNVLHAESSENVLIANETFTGLSLNLKTGFYDCDNNIGFVSWMENSFWEHIPTKKELQAVWVLLFKFHYFLQLS